MADKPDQGSSKKSGKSGDGKSGEQPKKVIALDENAGTKAEAAAPTDQDSAKYAAFLMKAPLSSAQVKDIAKRINENPAQYLVDVVFAAAMEDKKVRQAHQENLPVVLKLVTPARLQEADALLTKQVGEASGDRQNAARYMVLSVAKKLYRESVINANPTLKNICDDLVATEKLIELKMVGSPGTELEFAL